MKLILDSLENAVLYYDRALNTLNKKLSEDIIETLKAGIIQNFEFTYELCWKFMKRWLENNINSEEVLGVSRRQLFRLAAKNILIDDVDSWMDFHEARNKTSHIYDEVVAEEVFEKAKEFIVFAKKFLKVLKTKND